MNPIKAIPAEAYRRGPRNSKVVEVIRKSVLDDYGIIEVKGENVELERFYKALTQWKGRHPEVPVHLKKGNYRVFVQAIRPGQDATPPLAATTTLLPDVPVVDAPFTCDACGQELPIG